MGTVTERLAFILSLNADGAIKGFQDVGQTASRELKRADQSLDRLGSQMARVGTTMAASGLVGAVALSKLGTSAGDLNETLSKSDVIFGSAADRVESFGNRAAQASGLSKRAAIDAAATFGTLFTNIGKTSDEAASMSIQMSSLAGDLASFSNTSTEDAVMALGAALRGESEPIRRFGVLLDDATLKQRALTMGLYDGTGSLTPATRAQAAYAEILAQTAKQQGDFARTSGSLANQQRQLAAELENLKAGIGAGVVPAMKSMVGVAGDAVGAFNSLSPATQAGVGTFAAYASAGLVAAGSLSAVAGQAIKMRDRFTTLGADGATTGLNNFGKAAAGLGLAGAVVGLYQMGQAMHGLEVDAQKAARATTDELVAAFERLGQVKGTFAELGLNGEDVFRKIAEGSIGTAQRIRDGLAAAGQDVSKYDAILAELAAAQARANSDVAAGSKVVDQYGNAADSTAGSVTTLADAIDYAGLAADRTEGRMKALKASVFDLPNAQRDVADGWAAIDEAAQQSGGSTRDVEADMRRARDAAEGLQSAQESLADAERKLAEARQGPTARTKDDAQLKVREASIATQRAATALADAEKKVNEVRSKGTPGELASAELDLEEARIRAKRAATDVKDAQAAYNDVLHSGDENSKAVKAAQDELARAQLQVRTATEAVADAQKAAAPQGGAHRDTTKAIADAYEAQKKNIWDTVDAMVQQGKSQQEIDAFIDASGKKLDEYANKYKLAKVDVDEFKKSLDLLAILSNDNRTAAAAGGNYAPPAAIAQGAYDAARRDVTSSTSSANAAEYRLTARLAAPIMIDKRVLAEALIDLNVEHN